MADPLVDLFCEDSGHELFARSLIARLGRENGLTLQVETRSAIGGHGRALQELEAYQRTLKKGYLDRRFPELLVVVIDANRIGPLERERLVQERIDQSVFHRVVIGCPDPYVERWCFADPEAFARVMGVSAPPDSNSSGRDSYKAILKTAILEAGHAIVTNAMEFAPDLVNAMDLFRAGKNQPALKRFIDGLRDHFVQMGSTGR